MKTKTKYSGLKRRFVDLKIYFDRARMYLGYINFFMLNLVLINSFDNPQISTFVKEHQFLVLPALIIIYTVILILIGYFDTKLGFRQEEMRNNAMINPVMRDLLSTVKEIQVEVHKLTEKSN